MTGRTPDIFTLIGMWLDWPPYILRPTTRCAYCTGIRRSALVITTMNTMAARNSTRVKGTMNQYFIMPVDGQRKPGSQRCSRAEAGPVETMPANRIIEMPLPIPLLSICSPIHITRHRAGQEGDDDDSSGEVLGEALGISEGAVVAHQEVICHRLQQAQAHGAVPGDTC